MSRRLVFNLLLTSLAPHDSFVYASPRPTCAPPAFHASPLSHACPSPRPQAAHATGSVPCPIDLHAPDTTSERHQLCPNTQACHATTFQHHLRCMPADQPSMLVPNGSCFAPVYPRLYPAVRNQVLAAPLCHTATATLLEWPPTTPARGKLTPTLLGS